MLARSGCSAARGGTGRFQRWAEMARCPPCPTQAWQQFAGQVPAPRCGGGRGKRPGRLRWEAGSLLLSSGCRVAVIAPR
ncbi:hypothetical protein AV530_003565 [Patagioenas fasciata monilis]|uniref:Uncharacterized protein n=1 Tax=Patagioenas fasciata monilis TaxID=372326 RepID=A0A1V4KY26_PATFA|nr:hypothetical protein AV530_003565 [Patagioenas fasciata monilis]